MANGPLTGVVKWFKEDKGFGFITPDVPRDDRRDVFVYHSAIKMRGFRKLKEGQRVSFSVGAGPDGRTCAVNVEIQPGSEAVDGERHVLLD